MKKTERNTNRSGRYRTKNVIVQTKYARIRATKCYIAGKERRMFEKRARFMHIQFRKLWSIVCFVFMSFQGMKTTKRSEMENTKRSHVSMCWALHLGLISRRLIKITVSIPFEWTLCLRSFRETTKK